MTMQHDTQSRAVWGVVLAFAGYALALRLHGVREHFAFFGDQCLAWDYVDRPFWKIPLYGATTSDGMITWGPAFYWFLWLSKQAAGPFFAGLPVASGYAMAVFFTVSEACLIRVLLRRGVAWPAVAALALLFLSSSYINSLAAEPWAPPLALSLVNFALAALYAPTPPLSPRRAALSFALCVLAAQVHPTVIVVVFCVFVWLVGDAWRRDGLGLAAKTLLALVLTVLVLELPYLISRILHPEVFAHKSEAAQSLAQLLGDPSRIVPVRAFAAVFGGLSGMMVAWLPEVLGGLAAAAGGLALAVRRGWTSREVFTTITPLVCAGLGFSLHSLGVSPHWIVPFATCFSLAIALGLVEPPAGGLFGRTGRILGFAFVCVLALAQVQVWLAPGHRYEYYGVMERAVKRLAADGVAVRGVLPPDSDGYSRVADLRNFNMLAVWAGVRYDPDARDYAVVSPSGDIVFKSDPLPGNRQGFPEGIVKR